MLLPKKETEENVPKPVSPGVPASFIARLNSQHTTPENNEGASDIRLSNADFVATVFQDTPAGASAAICSKSGDPSDGGWFAFEAEKVVGGLPVGKNNYINGSSFVKDTDGSFKVRKDQFAACHFVMLDDLGTKVPMHQLGGFKLSWLIETSPGNFQGGITFSTAITEGTIAERLLNALIAAGLCDKGASGPLTRWARLPGGINGKPKYFDAQGKPFRCRLVQWNPDARYTPEEVATALHLVLSPIVLLKTVADPVEVNSKREIHSEPSPGFHSTPSTMNQANIKILLNHIDADIEHTEWLHVLMAIHFEFGGSDEGLFLANLWSSKGRKYKGIAEIENKWSYFKLGKENSFNIGTIINMVKAQGIDWMNVCAEADEQFQLCETIVVPSVRKFPRFSLPTSAIEVSDVPNVPVADSFTTAPIVASTSVTVEPDKRIVPVNPFDQYSLRGMSEEMEKNVVAAVPLLDEIALMGQVTVYFAKGNVGKTVITFKLLLDAIRAGRVNPNMVYYLNMDDTATGLVEKNRIAEEFNFHMIAEGHLDLSAALFKSKVRELIESDKAKGVVLILDTLKKFVNLMDKNQTSAFTNVIRPFVSKGGTVVALAHTNKNPDKNGNPVYGGVSDIMTDIDCAYTIAEVSAENGVKVVEFVNSKRRGNVVFNASYSYCYGNNVSYHELLASVQSVDDSQLGTMKLVEEIKSDAEVIDAVKACIKDGINTKMKLTDAVAVRANISKRSAHQIINKYTGVDPAVHRWNYSVGERGAQQFAILPATLSLAPPPQPTPPPASDF